MIIVQAMGGLGNQLFQYALYLYFRRNGRDAYIDPINFDNGIDPRKWLLPELADDLSIATVKERRHLAMDPTGWFGKHIRNAIGNKLFLYEERPDLSFDSRVLECKNAYLRGYWQTERYFCTVRDEVQKSIRFPELQGAYSDIEKDIRGSVAVSVHIRRGDYIELADEFGKLFETDYYEKAVSLMEERLENPVFYVFSDDIDWCRQRFSGRKNFRFVPGDSGKDYDDMYLMSLCRHNIIANSTFSWWGAYLNSNRDKIVVSPMQWMIDRATPDVLCEGWIKI